SRIIERNRLALDPPIILISKNHSPNAYTIGFNCIIFNVGLLARLKTEEELEFILSHELAHVQLKHVLQGIQRNFLVKKESEINKRSIWNKDSPITASEIVNLKSLYYQSGELRRSREEEADSLGFLYFTNGQNNPAQALAALDLLAKSKEPMYPRGELLLEPLHSLEYPIQGNWFRGRPRGYEMKMSEFLIFNLDSLQSHPNIDQRKRKIQEQLKEIKTDQANFSKFSRITGKVAEKATLDAAMFMNKYDHALHIALQFKWKYPDEDWPNSAIVSILIKVAQAKKGGVGYKYIQNYTAYYSDELKELNIVLYNLTAIEALEMAYYFFKKPGNYNPDHETHIYLKWEINRLTGRKKQAKHYKNELREKFPESKFLTSY
ncbi:MAG: M48 family metalloprotease, partial [Bacteroidota bacterium]